MWMKLCILYTAVTTGNVQVEYQKKVLHQKAVSIAQAPLSACHGTELLEIKKCLDSTLRHVLIFRHSFVEPKVGLDDPYGFLPSLEVVYDLHTQLWNWPQNFKYFVLSTKNFCVGIYLQAVITIEVCFFLLG